MGWGCGGRELGVDLLVLVLACGLEDPGFDCCCFVAAIGGDGEECVVVGGVGAERVVRTGEGICEGVVACCRWGESVRHGWCFVVVTVLEYVIFGLDFGRDGNSLEAFMSNGENLGR